MTVSSQVHGLVLAGGRSTRFRSATPKVLHTLLGKPLLHYPVTILRSQNIPVCLVLPPQEALLDHVRQHFPEVTVCEQPGARGTADAVRCGLRFLDARLKDQDWLLVVNGDVPLLSSETLLRLQQETQAARVPLGLVTAVVRAPTGYGRMKRDPRGRVIAIVEEKDATPEERAIVEINAGLYCFRVGFLRWGLSLLQASNAQGEYYLTDLVELSQKFSIPGVESGTVAVQIPVEREREVWGVNDRKQLAELTREATRACIEKWMSQGVTFELPDTVLIGPDVLLSEDCVIGPQVKLLGKTRLGKGVVLEGGNYLVDAVVEEGARLLWGTILEEAHVGARSHVGPYARLRPGSQLAHEVKIGNFVELKKASFGARSKASHLSYIGDAEIGEDVNIGCGFVTCNYDGEKKHRTVIKNGVFIGSDSQAVAPVTLGENAYVGAGTTVTEDVPAGALVLSRVKQTVKLGYSRKRVVEKG